MFFSYDEVIIRNDLKINLLAQIHNNIFKYIKLDLFDLKKLMMKISGLIIPNTIFSNLMFLF